MDKPASTIPVPVPAPRRVQWLGFLLDEARHFFGKEAVKALLDLADGGARTLQFAGTVASSVNAHLSGCALLDAVSCERVSDVPSNLVVNGGFENGTAQWTRDGFLNVVSAFVAEN